MISYDDVSDEIIMLSYTFSIMAGPSSSAYSWYCGCGRCFPSNSLFSVLNNLSGL
jgi:hypothetical protein